MTVLAPYTTPGTYEFQVFDLLHDPNANRWTTTQIDQYVNEARQQICMDTGCLRSLQQSYITQGQEVYSFGQVTGAWILTPGSGYTNPSVTFSGGGGTGVAATLTQSGGAVNTISFSNFGSGYSSAPTATVTDAGPGTGCTIAVGILNIYTYDPIGIHLLWGTQRYTLQWSPFRKFSAWYRPWTAASFQRQPVAWCEYADTQVYIGPTPDQTYAVEFDTVILPTPLAAGDSTTVDNIPGSQQTPIKFYAAYLAKLNVQSFGEADTFLKTYQRRMLECNNSYTGRIPDIYRS